MTPLFLLLVGCDAPQEPDTAEPPAPPNVLVVVADDLGIDNVGAWQSHPDAASTPRIDALADSGRRFVTTWATPSCSPARAQILTGRHGRRYGMGIRISLAPDAPPFSLRREELTLGELARTAGYATSFVGKWHLDTYDTWLTAPHEQGFDWFAISGGNLELPSVPEPADFFHWQRNENGNVAFTDTYTTTSQADDAIARLTDMPEPWLLVLAFNAPHEPFHSPPEHLHSRGDVSGRPIPVRYRAAVEALDTELGRVLDALEAEALAARTHVVLVGDNGTPQEAILPPLPFFQGKPSLTEGGMRVPLILTGPGIEPGPTERMASLVDLFPTIGTWMGAPSSENDLNGLELDGVDLAPWLADPDAPGADTVLFGDRFDRYDHPDDSPFLQWAIRERRWKYLTNPDGDELVFDLEPTWWETEPLPLDEVEPEVLDRLRTELDAALAARPFDY